MQKQIKTKLKYEEIPIKIYPLFMDDRIVSSITYEIIQEYERSLAKATSIPANIITYEKTNLS
jgi:hypothetical protein